MFGIRDQTFCAAEVEGTGCGCVRDRFVVFSTCSGTMTLLREASGGPTPEPWAALGLHSFVLGVLPFPKRNRLALISGINPRQQYVRCYGLSGVKKYVNVM